MRRWGEIAAGLHVRRSAVWYGLAAAGCALLVWAAASTRPSAPVVETVATGGRPATAAATPFYVTQPQLPPRDAEVEQAGDRIAEVEVYLKKRQSAAALAALARARRATAPAPRAGRPEGPPRRGHAP